MSQYGQCPKEVKEGGREKQGLVRTTNVSLYSNVHGGGIEVKNSSAVWGLLA